MKLPALAGTVLAGASGLLCAVLAALYTLRPDWAAAATIWPSWVWLLPGWPLASLAWNRERPRPAVAALLGWGVFLLLFIEEPRSLARGLLPPPSGDRLRVVSLNCAGGSEEAAAEVSAYRPDVVLLQETPGREEVRTLGRRLFGAEAGVVWGPDTSILARGAIREKKAGLRVSHFVLGRAALPGLPEVGIVSLRLTPPVVRFDLWDPGCWREQAENRRVRREQLAEMVSALAGLPADLPLIVGGDFNAPAGDAVYRLLRPRLRDPFAEAGRGWGNTALNDIPVSRIDQVWASRHFRALSVTARKMVQSDHRLVLCDLAVVD